MQADLPDSRSGRWPVRTCMYRVVHMRTISIRIPDADLATIDDRANSLGVSRTAFLLRAALDRSTADEQRFAEFEDRLARVEAALFQ